jgi:YidC/Oxa1 family membrane protein insertase
MEKNALLAFILTLLVLFFFQFFLSPPRKVEKPPPKRQEQKELKGETKPSKIYRIETPLLRVEISDLGGAIRSVKLKEYKETVKSRKEKELIEEISPYSYVPMLLWETGDDRFYFECDKENLQVAGREEGLSCEARLPDGKTIKKVYTFHPSAYTIGFGLTTEGWEGERRVDFAAISWKGKRSYVFKGPIVYDKGLKQIDKIKDTLSYGSYKYAGFDEGYFAFLIIPEQGTPPLSLLRRGETPVISLTMRGKELRGRLYVGPKRSDLLKSLNVQAEKIIDFGWFDFIAKPLVLWLTLTHRFTRNYGVDIIILTILIKILFYPLTLLSYKSMKEMQRLQPYIQKLREKYKDDKQRLNQELMELYRRKKINPMSGCLPILVQIPVFIALYKALSLAIELRHAPFVLWIKDLSSPEDLYTFHVLGFSIPIRILPLIMGFTQYVQQKMTPTSLDPMQEKIMLFMPIFFTFLFWGFSSGLVLYWLTNNVISIVQQYYINKKLR